MLEPYLGKSRFNHHGQRVVEGQRLTQAASDIMLGWIRRRRTWQGVSRDFYIRQLWDGKGSALVELMDPKAMTLYARLCGHALAKAHARSGDAIAIASYLGGGDSFDRALASFAEAYADQNERDYNALQKAVTSGRARPSALRAMTRGRWMSQSPSSSREPTQILGPSPSPAPPRWNSRSRRRVADGLLTTDRGARPWPSRHGDGDPRRLDRLAGATRGRRRAAPRR